MLYADTILKEELVEAFHDEPLPLLQKTLVRGGVKRLELLVFPFDERVVQFRIVIQERNNDYTHTICYTLDEAIKEYNETLR
jgi:hypothetical protein